MLNYISNQLIDCLGVMLHSNIEVCMCGCSLKYIYIYVYCKMLQDGTVTIHTLLQA